MERLSTGVRGLDAMLGGGILPNTLTVVAGATGIGKTQLGLQFLNAGLQQDGQRGVVFDLNARGDSQHHREYAQRLFGWSLDVVPADGSPDLTHFFDPARGLGDYLHVFDYRGRRVTRQDLEADEWREWQVELNARLRTAIAFLYGSFVSGRRRLVFDGIEPADRPHESVQLNLFEYLYHQVVRKDPEWVARDLFRESYRRMAAEAARHVYDPTRLGCVLLYTSHESMLDELISRPLDEGDVLSNANTLIYLGKVRDGSHIRRAAYVAKHRGSACSDEIRTYEIDERGLQLGS
jgi:KaiC/GvpD/RAD55 family RecA-like ATPase